MINVRHLEFIRKHIETFEMHDALPARHHWIRIDPEQNLELELSGLRGWAPKNNGYERFVRS